MSPRSKHRLVSAARAAVAAACLAVGGVFAWSVVLPHGAAPASAANPPLTASQLAAKLSAAATAATVPANLHPPLALATQAKPMIVLNSCSLQRAGTRSKPCIYGDRNSHTPVVVFGDSHAAAWFPALDLISKQQHWRLVDLTKAGCPTAEVNVRFLGSNVTYPQCTAWRHNAERLIAALHPALVIVSQARWEELEAQPEPGVPTGYGSPWLNGMAATFGFLRHVSTHVVFVSDVPYLSYSAPDCVASHLSDVYQCDAARSTAVLLPQVKSAEIALAKREHVNWIDPTSWFCAPTTCPVIVGNILLYRDNAHMTPAWSRFIAPLLANSILPIMNRPS